MEITWWKLVCGACLIGIDYPVCLCLLMNVGFTYSKQEHSKEHPKDLSPSYKGRLLNMMLNMRALMFQIHDEA